MRKFLHIKPALVAGFGMVIVACHSQPQAVIVPLPRGKQSVAKAQVSNAPLGSVANVRSTESVKAYGINRYVDPNDPRILHERHAIYRLEEQPNWVTRSRSSRDQVLLGPLLGLKRPEYTPEALPDETARDLAKTKQGLKTNEEALHNLQQNQLDLTRNIETLAAQTVDSQKKLTEIVSVLNDRIKQLETDCASRPTADERSSSQAQSTSVKDEN
jgi:hypothetical protein